MGIVVRRLTGDDWRTLRDVRLAALADAPGAYGSTLAREQGLGQADWRGRSGTGLWAVAVLGTVSGTESGTRSGTASGTGTGESGTAGLVGVHLAERDTPVLVSLWVRPEHRGRGVADALVAEVLRWGGENRWSRVVLRVADGNGAARALFRRHGFSPTGVRAPLESDPGVGTELLARAI
jgi:ribosomal protein S18 acetylase RimI-like enzyme